MDADGQPPGGSPRSGRSRRIAAGGVVAATLAVAATVAWRSGAQPDNRTTVQPPARAVSAATPPTTAPPGPVQWVTTDERLTVGGIARRYMVVRPARMSTTPLPVVVVLHGRVAGPELEEQRTGFPPLVGRAILVYPAGYQQSWNAGACCAGAHDAGVDDVAFLTEVVHRVLATQHDAAPGRVFLVGFSNGGKMAFRLGCADPSLFQGIAVVGAVPVAACDHPPVVPFAELVFHDDPLLTLTPDQPRKPVNGFLQVSVEEEVAARRATNACQADGVQQVQGTLTTTRWDHCRSGKPVELGVYQGSTHIWPAGNATTPSAEQVIWTFFRSITEDRQ